MKTTKEEFTIYNVEIEKNYSPGEIYTKTPGQLILIANSYSNIINGGPSNCLISTSRNTFVLETNIVYVARKDYIYTDFGTLTIEFSFKKEYTNVTDTIFSDYEIYHLKPIFQGGQYKDKHIIVELTIFKDYRIYKIITTENTN